MLIEKFKNIQVPRFFQTRTFAVTFLLLILASAVLSVTAGIKTVMIYDGETVTTVRTMSASPEAILEQAGITLAAEDTLTAETLTGGLSSLRIARAFDVLVAADGEVFTVKRVDGTVTDALEKSGVYIDSADELNLAEDTPVHSGMSIDVTRVAYNYVHMEQRLT
jgi:uncharacterized protein YabE (DUF348 family)